MTAHTLPARQPEGRAYRIAHGDRPWEFPDWSCVRPMRWGDPESEYRVLYGCSTPQGCYVECLARFRPAPAAFQRRLASIVGEEGDAEPIAAGVVPRSWFAPRYVGEASLDGDYADIGHSEWLAHLNEHAERFGVPDVDLSTVLSSDRRVTQAISRYVWEMTTEEGLPEWAGIAYPSRLGADFLNWAVFEHPTASHALHLTSTRLRQDDAACVETCELLRLRVE